MRRPRLVLAIVMLGAAALACGEATPTPASGPADPWAIEIAAANVEFSPSGIDVPAGADLHVRFDNRDGDVPHNLVLMAGAQFLTKLVETPVAVGPVVQELAIPGLLPGSYRFICTVHPIMTVDLNVGG